MVALESALLGAGSVLVVLAVVMGLILLGFVLSRTPRNIINTDNVDEFNSLAMSNQSQRNAIKELEDAVDENGGGGGG